MSSPACCAAGRPSARIGRTIATACAGGTQVDAACLKVKTAGGEVEAELTTRNAMCNSACGYLFLGATTREVAPDAAIAVHNSRLTLHVRGPFSAQQIADFKQRGMARADRERAAFVVSMGIGRELDDLIKTVKFESLHVLTRAELYRFGIDTRPLPETAWTLEAASRPYVRKIAAAKQGDGASFRTMEWRLFCENKDRARLMFVRESDPSGGGLKTMMLTAGSDKSVAFGKYPARVGKYEVWSDVVAPDAMQAMLAASRLQMGEGTLERGGQDDPGDVRHRYAWPRRVMDAAPGIVPGQHRPACGGVHSQHQPCSGNSGDFRGSRNSGEVSAGAPGRHRFCSPRCC